MTSSVLTACLIRILYVRCVLGCSTIEVCERSAIWLLQVAGNPARCANRLYFRLRFSELSKPGYQDLARGLSLAASDPGQLLESIDRLHSLT